MFQDIIYIEIKHDRWIKNSVSIVVLLQVQGQGLLHLVKLFNLFIVQCTIFLLFAVPRDLFALWKKLGCFLISISRLAKELFSLLNTAVCMSWGRVLLAQMFGFSLPESY